MRLYCLHGVPSRGRLTGYGVTPNPVMVELAKPKCALNEAQWTRVGVDLEKKLAVWEHFYNFDRPHGAHGGKTPYEALRKKLS